MYQILKTSHSHAAWLVLVGLVVIIGLFAINKIAKKQFSAAELKIALVVLILSHIQLLMGLALYFISPLGFNNLSGATMKDPYARLMAVEHPITNILAIIFITIGYSKAKKLLNTDKGYNTVLIYYGLGLILLLSRVPWQTWLG